jgi:hypothetical protein
LSDEKGLLTPKRVWFFVGVLLACIAVALCIVPAPVDPMPVRIATGQGVPSTSIYVAVHPLDFGPLAVPEGLAIDSAGQVYAGAADGFIYRSPGPEKPLAWESWAKVGGYPIGLAFDAHDQSLWAANYGVGLQHIQPDGTWNTPLQSHDGKRFGFVDDLVVGSDGVVYFSEASTKFSPLTHAPNEPFILWEVLEGRAHGQILAYSPIESQLETLVARSFFPSGIALSRDEAAIYFIEVTRARLVRYWLSGPAAGSSETVVQNLPGIPDDVLLDDQGHAWVSLVSQRDGFVDRWIQPYPWIKKLISRLPDVWLMALQDITPTGSLLKIDLDSGALCHVLFDTPLSPANLQIAGDKLLMSTLYGSQVWQISVLESDGCG